MAWNNLGASPTKVTWANPQVVPESQRQSGAWYYNPDSGYVERWWSEGDNPQPSGGDATSNYLDQISQTLTTTFGQSQDKVAQYLKDNPFAYDDAWLAATEKQVKEEVNSEPYYKEKLSNYLDDVKTRKDRAQQDEATLLQDLEREQKYYLKEGSLQYQKSREAALQGISDQNLIDTGSGQRELNRGESSYKSGVENYLGTQEARKQQAQQTTSRLLSDLQTNENRFTTDLEREKQLQVQSQIQQRKQEQQNYWQAGLLKAQGQVAPGVNAYLG